ncbi:ABC transporter substrate-binding protein [Timonella senegalensis]|uniref:ABC transporter substrate-binding protein n=1 Tax=Timonella senegalensis TaxID=1465825 RepID=UPI0028B2506A|nr:extracellular solute-binding protein [Timonella senegalensis]
MRTRRLPAIIASVAALTLLGACASDPETPDAEKPGATEEGGALKGDVDLWVYPVIADEVQHRAFWDKHIEGFKKENPDVNVKVEIFPWANRDEAITTAVASGTTPDAIYLIPDQLANYADALESVDEYISADHVKDILPNVVENVSIDGRMVGVPILTSSNTLICNAAAFEEAGVTDYPTTLDEFMALGDTFKAKDIYLSNYRGAIEETLNMTFYPYLWQMGGNVFAEDGSIAFNSPEGVKALEYVKTLVDKGYSEKDLVTTTPAAEQTAIAKGKVACTNSNAPVDVEPFWGLENIKVLPPLKDAEQVAYGTVGSFSMFKGGDAKDATGAFLDYVTTGEPLKEYLTTSKFFSPLASTGALYEGDPIYGEIEKTIQYVTVGDLHPKAREVMGTLAPEIQAALLGNKTPEQALNDAAKEAEFLLN